MTVQTLPFKQLIEINRKSGIPVFRQVANGLMTLIREGKIRPGYQLPASRSLAATMKLNRTTVVAAYDELRAQGWAEGVGKKGMFVSRQLPIVNPKILETDNLNDPEVIDQPKFYRHVSHDTPSKLTVKPYHLIINDGYPDQRIAPLGSILDRYKELMNRTHLHGKFITGNSLGSLSLRAELALFLSKTRALNSETENILVTQGAQLAIYIAASMILKPGSKVIVGDINYILANKLFEQLGATLVKIKVDENGIDVDEIEKICQESCPDLLYIIPHHHHPTTVTLSAERRIKLLDIIRRYKLPVIEDDYDYDFHYENSPILPLASADQNGFVLYIGSISKTLASTVRLGFLVGSADFIWQASKLKQLVTIRGDELFEESVAHLFNTGEMLRHIRRSVKLYRQRRDQFCELLNSSIGDIAQFAIPQGGMAVWATFDKDYAIHDLSRRLASKAIYMNEGSIYQYSENVKAMRLGFASLNTIEMLKFTEILGQVK